MKPIQIELLCFGTVSTGVAKLLIGNADVIHAWLFLKGKRVEGCVVKIRSGYRRLVLGVHIGTSQKGVRRNGKPREKRFGG